jgi:NADP-dependent 3-hydroxy acid dehydrogenase YdfG
MKRLEGKTALVTGASRGIGRAIAVELAREGAKVAVNYASSDAAAHEVEAEIAQLGSECLLLKADLADAKQARAMVKQAAEHFGHLDILVNNAGITRDALLTRMTDEQWVEVVSTNLNSCFYCTSAAIPFMSAQSFGRIVNITSLNGQVAATGQANYSASKGGIIAFTRTAATPSTASPRATPRPTCSPRCRRRSRRRSSPRSRWRASPIRTRSPRPFCSSWPTATTSPASRSTSTAAPTMPSAKAPGDGVSGAGPPRPLFFHITRHVW